MDDNWNELMERETQQFQADMQRETIDELTAENAKLRDLLCRAADTIAELSGGGAHLVIMQEIHDNTQELKVRPVDVFDAAISLCNAYNAGRDELTAENAKLREQLAECDVKLEEAIDMLVNLYDLGNLDDEWMGKVAMVLAKNDK